MAHPSVAGGHRGAFAGTGGQHGRPHLQHMLLAVGRRGDLVLAGVTEVPFAALPAHLGPGVPTDHSPEDGILPCVRKRGGRREAGVRVGAVPSTELLTSVTLPPRAALVAGPRGLLWCPGDASSLQAPGTVPTGFRAVGAGVLRGEGRGWTVHRERRGEWGSGGDPFCTSEWDEGSEDHPWTGK